MVCDNCVRYVALKYYVRVIICDATQLILSHVQMKGQTFDTSRARFRLCLEDSSVCDLKRRFEKRT